MHSAVAVALGFASAANEESIPQPMQSSVQITEGLILSADCEHLRRCQHAFSLDWSKDF